LESITIPTFLSFFGFFWDWSFEFFSRFWLCYRFFFLVEQDVLSVSWRRRHLREFLSPFRVPPTPHVFYDSPLSKSLPLDLLLRLAWPGRLSIFLLFQFFASVLWDIFFARDRSSHFGCVFPPSVFSSPFQKNIVHLPYFFASLVEPFSCSVFCFFSLILSPLSSVSPFRYFEIPSTLVNGSSFYPASSCPQQLELFYFFSCLWRPPFFKGPTLPSHTFLRLGRLSRKSCWSLPRQSFDPDMYSLPQYWRIFSPVFFLDLEVNRRKGIVFSPPLTPRLLF